MLRSVSAPSSVTNTSPCWNGDIVPGSTLMYGSSLRLVTRTPREARIAASDAAAMPFPREETTPPVTNTNLVMGGQFRKLVFYRNRRRVPSASDLQSRSDARARCIATDEFQHGVDRRRLERSRDQHAQRHHHLRGLEAVACRRRLERSADHLARPVQVGEFRVQLGECGAIGGAHLLGEERRFHANRAVEIA